MMKKSHAPFISWLLSSFLCLTAATVFSSSRYKVFDSQAYLLGEAEFADSVIDQLDNTPDLFRDGSNAWGILEKATIEIAKRLCFNRLNFARKPIGLGFFSIYLPRAPPFIF